MGIVHSLDLPRPRFASTTDEPVYRGHRCQPFTGYDPHLDDPQFRLAYQRNPWCWSEELGFHRAQAPHVPLVAVGITGQSFVGAGGMDFWQALRLGAGWGTSIHPQDGVEMTEQTSRVFEVVDRAWEGDLEPVARLGRLAGRVVAGGAQDRIEEDDVLLQGWFRDAVAAFLPAPHLSSGWNAVLGRAVRGRHSLGDTAWVEGQVPANGWDDRVQVWRYLTGAAAHNGGMRSICAVYRGASPSQDEAMAWMMLTLRHALRWGGHRTAHRSTAAAARGRRASAVWTPPS